MRHKFLTLLYPLALLIMLILLWIRDASMIERIECWTYYCATGLALIILLLATSDKKE